MYRRPSRSRPVWVKRFFDGLLCRRRVRLLRLMTVRREAAELFDILKEAHRYPIGSIARMVCMDEYMKKEAVYDREANIRAICFFRCWESKRRVERRSRGV